MVLNKQAVTKCRKNQNSLFHKSRKKYNMPSPLPTLKINNHNIERVNTRKFLSLLLNENLSWKEHIKYLKVKQLKAQDPCTEQNHFYTKNLCQRCITRMSTHIEIMLTQLGVVLIERIWKNYAVNKNTLFEQSIIRQNLNIQKNFLNQQMY